MDKNIYETICFIMVVLPCTVLICFIIKWIWLTELHTTKKEVIKDVELIDHLWKIGNVLVTRSHDKFIVIGDNHAISYEGRIARHNYTSDLHASWSNDGSMDIMAVYSKPYNIREMNVLETQRLLWERSI